MILITGHKGLIGSALFKKFKAIGFDRGDPLIDQKYDLIIHTAANCSIRQIIKYPELAKENIDLTYKVFELARKYNSKLVLFSSGRVAHQSYNPYTVDKRFMENMARAYRDCYGVKSIIIRPETVWGESNNNKRVVMEWIEAASQNKPLYIYGPKYKELPPIYVDDFADIVYNLIIDFDNFVGQTISIAGQIRKAKDIAKAIVKQFKSKSKIVFMKGELTQPQKCYPSDIISDIPFEKSFTKSMFFFLDWTFLYYFRKHPSLTTRTS